MQLFHYHLATSKLRAIEGRYLGKLGFRLVARYGRIGERLVSYEPGVAWEDLDRVGFKLRLSELERGAVNVAVQPGHWEVPRIDHIGLSLDEDEFQSVLARASERGLRVQEHGGRRTFITTGVGYRIEVYPPREWLDELLREGGDLHLAALHLRADDPLEKASALAEILDAPLDGNEVALGATIVRFVPGGPEGRPELHAESFA